MRNDTSIKPVLMAILGVALFSALDAMMKIIASAYPLAQSTGMRYAAGALVAASFYLAAGAKWPSRDAVLRSLPRTFANVLAGTCFFLAVSRLSLVDAVVLTYLSPLFLSFWGRVLLGEPLKRSTSIAILTGLIGVFVIAHGQSLDAHHDFDFIGFMAAIACAAFYALSMAMTRRQSVKDSLPTLVLLPNIGGALLTALPMAWSWQPVSLGHYGVIFGVGLFGTAAYAALVWAYAHSHMGRVGLFEYTGFVWAVIFGYFIFYEVPSAWSIAGALLIIVSCLPAFR